MQAASHARAANSTHVCLACKQRHRRCDWDDDTCSQCKETGTRCIRQPALKFRYHPNQKALSRSSSNLFQPCKLPAVPVRFYDETPALQAIYQIEDEGTLRPTASPLSLSPQTEGFSLTTTTTEVTPAVADVAHSRPVVSQVSNSFAYPEYAFDRLAPLTSDEALLLRNFTSHMAQWTDVADPFRTFETEISRLALTDLVVRYAICAFSARHFYRCQEGEDGDAEALDYQNRCLNLIIPSMSNGQSITTSVLTAVALLRQNEEMDGEYTLIRTSVTNPAD